MEDSGHTNNQIWIGNMHTVGEQTEEIQVEEIFGKKAETNPVR